MMTGPKPSKAGPHTGCSVKRCAPPAILGTVVEANPPIHLGDHPAQNPALTGAAGRLAARHGTLRDQVGESARFSFQGLLVTGTYSC